MIGMFLERLRELRLVKLVLMGTILITLVGLLERMNHLVQLLLMLGGNALAGHYDACARKTFAVGNNATGNSPG
jgi:hypothetical protein